MWNLFRAQLPPQPTLPREMLGPENMGLSATDAWQMVMSGRAPSGGLRPMPVRQSIVKAIQTSAESYLLRKSVENNYWRSVEKSQKAALQGSVVNPALDYWGGYETGGTEDKTGTTFDACRRMAQNNEVLAAIISKRVLQVTSYARRAVIRRGRTSEPGFKIKLADPDERATAADKKRMAELEQFIEECGYVPPPEEEKPLGWQPGFDMFLGALVRDSLTLDHVAVRRWKSTEYPEQFPIVAFACEDAGAIRHVGREVIEVRDGVEVTREWEHERTNTRQEIAFKKLTDGGQVLEEYSASEMFTAFRRPRTDRYANGYGFSEIEEAWITATLWCASRDFNGMRFSKNSLPRGMWVVFGNVSDQQFNAFQLSIKQQMTGLKNANNIPVFRGMPQAGSSVQFVPVDPSPKDMEHGQSIFTYGVWMHALYNISPDETGFSATSPFRPPLSEASPETNLKYSQDTGLRPLLRWIENVLNREIIWRVEPSRRYKFEFVGVGDYDELQDIQVRTARLQAGLSTPAMEWDELDIAMPDEIRSNPAANFPAPFAVGMQMLQGMAQQEQQNQVQQQAAEQQQAQQQRGQDMENFKAAKEGYAPADDGRPPQAQQSAPPPGSQPVGTPAGIANPASPILKAIGWPFLDREG